jgi:hypothetical protein
MHPSASGSGRVDDGRDRVTDGPQQDGHAEGGHPQSPAGAADQPGEIPDREAGDGGGKDVALVEQVDRADGEPGDAEPAWQDPGAQDDRRGSTRLGVVQAEPSQEGAPYPHPRGPCKSPSGAGVRDLRTPKSSRPLLAATLGEDVGVIVGVADVGMTEPRPGVRGGALVVMQSA